MATKTTISKLKKGDLFTFKLVDSDWIPEHLMYVRGDYNRSTKKYEYYKYSDVNHFGEAKRDRIVYI